MISDDIIGGFIFFGIVAFFGVILLGYLESQIARSVAADKDDRDRYIN